MAIISLNQILSIAGSTSRNFMLSQRTMIEMRNKTIIEAIIFIYMLVFIYAAVSKLIDHELFMNQLSRSSMLANYPGIVSWAVPGTELIISFLLFIPSMRLPGLYLAFMLMAMFTLYIAVITRFTDNAPCSCGGILEKMTWDQHLVFNIVLLVLGGYAVWIYPGKRVGKIKTG